MGVIETAHAAEQVVATTGVSLKGLMGFAGAWTTLLSISVFWAVKWLLSQHQAMVAKQFDAVGKRFDLLNQKMEDDQKSLHRLERDVMTLKADLPLHYVRKEDAVRHEAVFNAKLDGLAMKIDNLNTPSRGNPT